MQASAEATARRRAAVVRVWYMLAVGGLAVFSLHAIHGFGGPTVDDFFNRTLYNALILLAVVGCALRVVWVRGERGAWIALTIAIAMWATGEILFDFAPACYVGLVLLVRGRVSRLNGSVWLDGAMAALTAAAVGAALLFEAVL